MEKIFNVNLGDDVWVMNDNIAETGKVTKIWYTKFISPADYKTICENEIYYVSFNGTKIGTFGTNEIFKTKQDLLKSL